MLSLSKLCTPPHPNNTGTKHGSPAIQRFDHLLCRGSATLAHVKAHVDVNQSPEGDYSQLSFQDHQYLLHTARRNPKSKKGNQHDEEAKTHLAQEEQKRKGWRTEEPVVNRGGTGASIASLPRQATTASARCRMNRPCLGEHNRDRIVWLPKHRALISRDDSATVKPSRVPRSVSSQPPCPAKSCKNGLGECLGLIGGFRGASSGDSFMLGGLPRGIGVHGLTSLLWESRSSDTRIEKQSHWQACACVFACQQRHPTGEASYRHCAALCCTTSATRIESNRSQHRLSVPHATH
jgi:hypothetical protein